MQFAKLAAIVLPFASQALAALQALPANGLVEAGAYPTPAPKIVHVRRDTESCASSRLSELGFYDNAPTNTARLGPIRPTISCTMTAPASKSSDYVSYVVTAEAYLSHIYEQADKHPEPGHCGGQVDLTISLLYCSEPSITLQFTGASGTNATATSTVIKNNAKITRIAISAGVPKAVSSALLAGVVGAAALMVL